MEVGKWYWIWLCVGRFASKSYDGFYGLGRSGGPQHVRWEVVADSLAVRDELQL